MSPPTVRVNTFVIENEKPQVDPISKMFIVFEAMLGLNRLPLIGRGKFIYVFLTFIVHLITIFTVIYISITSNLSMNVMMMWMMWSKIVQNTICVVLSFTRCKWMLLYYEKLTTFDAEAGCRPKVTTGSIRNVVQTGLTIVLTIVIFTFFPMINHQTTFQFVPLHVIYILEVHYFGHLLSLLVPRLKLINVYLESSLSSANSNPQPILKEFVFSKTWNGKLGQCHMRKLMDLYEVVVEIYDFLIEGIKWQLLGTIVMAFVSILGYLYLFSLRAIRSGKVLTHNALIQVGLTTILVAPLFAPCTLGDCVHSEVKKLRELLASKLYENKLDKSGRSVARALLAFTETRNLSFRLLRMLNIDISLPFKFAGLLVTYLIILLQFERVLNP